MKVLMLSLFAVLASTAVVEAAARCGNGRIRIDGVCVLKRDAATYCGPGYRVAGKTCVFGYRAPDRKAPLPSWPIQGLRKGCPRGLAWNRSEGCHEND